MSYLCSPRSGSARPPAGGCPVPGVPAAPGSSSLDVDCLSGICLPSSFQTGSWLLDHCAREPGCEPPACPPASRGASPGRAACPRQPACLAAPCSAACSRPLTFVSSSGKPAGGSAGGQPGAPRAYKRPCVSGCRRPC